VVYEGAVNDGLFHRIHKEDVGSTEEVDVSHPSSFFTYAPSRPYESTLNALDYQEEIRN
jgi:hypothetical protein